MRCRWKPDDDAQTRRVILQPQASIMETRHRRGERKTEAGARPRARVFEPDESIEHAQAIVFGDPRTMIRDDEFDIAATSPRREFDGGGGW